MKPNTQKPRKMPTTADISNPAKYLLAMKDFIADVNAEEFFASSTAEIGFYTCMIDSLITEQDNAKFNQLFSGDIIKEYHEEAYGHLYKSRKSYNWHLVHKHHIPDEIVTEHCTTRTRKTIADCAQKMYDMLTSNKVRNIDCEDRTKINVPEKHRDIIHILAATLDDLIAAKIIHAKKDNAGNIIEAKPWIFCLCCQKENCLQGLNHEN